MRPTVVAESIAVIFILLGMWKFWEIIRPTRLIQPSEEEKMVDRFRREQQ